VGGAHAVFMRQHFRAALTLFGITTRIGAPIAYENVRHRVLILSNARVCPHWFMSCNSRAQPHKYKATQTNVRQPPPGARLSVDFLSATASDSGSQNAMVGRRRQRSIGPARRNAVAGTPRIQNAGLILK
jgi:hypothetical protein